MSAGKDWVERARGLFATPKPEHFTDFNHCCECAEHDETLRSHDVETIGLSELGNAGWDPLCFCSAAGLRYYFPALVRLSLQSVDDDFYFEQLLFHLEYEWEQNRLLTGCNRHERQFVADFIAHMILDFPGQLDENQCQDTALRVHGLWAGN